MIKHVAVLDAGTTEMRVLVAKIAESGETHIIAKSAVPCKGLKKCGIEDQDEFVDGLKKCIKRIRERTEIAVKSVYVSIQGSNVKNIQNIAEIDFPEGRGTVTPGQIGKLLDKVSTLELHEDEHLIDVFPMYYIVDGGVQVKDPVGMSVSSIKVIANVIVADAEYISQLKECLQLAGLKADGFIPLNVALTPLLPPCEEGDNSTLVIDVGGTVTDYVLYYKNKPFSFGSVPVGGDHITNDIAMVLDMTVEESNTVKCDYPLAATELVSNNVDIGVYSVSQGMQQKIKVMDLVEIMQARIEEIFKVVANTLEQQNVDVSAIDNVMFLGSGILRFKGLDIITAKNFSLPLKEFDFTRLTGMKDSFTYASGMVMYISKLLSYGRQQSEIEKFVTGAAKSTKTKKSKTFGDKIKEFFGSFKD